MEVENNIQLFLLHFAGGSRYSYEFLKSHFDPRILLFPLELPGRGKRNHERLIREKGKAIEDYVVQIKTLRNSGMPYLIYGHSMGATLGLSVASKMEEAGDAPQALIVSGNAGPGLARDDKKRYLMDDAEFKKELRQLGGVPEEVFNDDDLYGFFSPLIRSDFEILEKDVGLEKGLGLNSPICAVMGDEEEEAGQIENWSRYTNADFTFHVLSGNHFFIHDHPEELAYIITMNSFKRRQLFFP